MCDKFTPEQVQHLYRRVYQDKRENRSHSRSVDRANSGTSSVGSSTNAKRPRQESASADFSTDLQVMECLDIMKRL